MLCTLCRCSRQKMHLYSIASPGMRRQPEDREGLGIQEQEEGWSEPVNMRAGWVQTQKGYFEAPSEYYLLLIGQPTAHIPGLLVMP